VADFRLSRPAQDAIELILLDSEREFGARARLRYEALLLAAILDVAADPARPGSKAQQDIDPAVRLYHLASSRMRVPDPPGRVREPRHLLVYEAGPDGVVDILGLLHERMLRPRALRRILREAHKRD
jgi:toxin ParE1/3/4